ncbi:MAG: hypothetical protein COV57_00260 [Candidatus Liptonbacteria bacterium CG11_big_fil_rev_8_21_14_0_20_35_14]|uniref:Methenyltetrahydrofolate cyclohydrolase n=1 Tax=Candidatus Liptonbacteria bacterium CG11_big_fil_rev_8_21_14_0_20_35_14 TaxID=1974634 RepID=A0A2H0N8I9_9BACT|nr:MAG: hypothetical protein COV57_00260 [Candidatus Liptonbacteria bacterium CG11_big_fil_rev_8_21_14_0_20_35_14]
MKIDGNKIQAEILDNLKKQEKPKGILVAVLVGNNEASQSFLKIKKKVAEELGVDFRIYEFDENISTNKLREEVVRISKQKSVRGVIVQLPLPGTINRDRVLKAMPAEKDIDALNENSIYKAPAVLTGLTIIERQGLILNNLSCAVVGAGFLVGKPMTDYLIGKVKKITIFEEGSDLRELVNYDLVILGTGKAGLVDDSNIKDGALVIDFGYYEGKGDLSLENISEEINYTPTPGGTGPVLVAKLFENFYKTL